jgi:hypothetical protein
MGNAAGGIHAGAVVFGFAGLRVGKDGPQHSVSPAMNSWATCRLNSMIWERCLAMAFIL